MQAPPDIAALHGARFRHRGGTFELAVDSLALAAGERVAVIGPSGSGKTTLLHLLAGILVPNSGTAELMGRSLGALDEAARRVLRARHVGLVLQELELLEHLTVTENVLLPYYAVPGLALTAATVARARALLARVGLADKAARKPERLSQGERQRVAVARALITEPQLVLGDEPTGNLDPETSRQVLGLLQDEARRTGATLVMVTHDHGLLGRFERVVDVRDLGAVPAPRPEGQR
jgi:putative ABC transport system ATP-binding protein